MSRIDLTIVLVNYNGASVLAPCLDSVFASQGTLSFEVIVVDNASQDNSLEILDRYSSQISLIKNDINRGFSRGNNQGASQGSGRYVFLLNNDTIVDPDMFQACLDYYDAHPTIGALGPRLLNQDRTIQRTGGILGQHQYRSHLPTEVSFLSGAALMLSRGMWDKVGGLDEHYFFYNEDLDLCKVIQKQGGKLVYSQFACSAMLITCDICSRGLMFEGTLLFEGKSQTFQNSYFPAKPSFRACSKNRSCRA